MTRITKGIENRYASFALVFICVVAVVQLLYFFSLKRDFHNDEYTSFTIANNSAGSMTASFEYNNLFSDIDEPYLASMAVQPGHQFNLAQVMRNDSEDTLPPLYYILLHCAFSFFPGTFSIWYCAIVNCILQIICILTLYFLMRELRTSEGLSWLSCALFALLPGTLEIALFVRMYILAMLWVLALSLGCVRLLHNSAFSAGNFLLMTVALLGGCLTHYFFLIFAFFQYLTVGIILLIRRKWRAAILLIASAVVAAVAATLFFPPIIGQLFSGRLNDEGMRNLAEEDTLSRILSFISIIDSRLFGGLLIAIILFPLACIILSKFDSGPSRFDRLQSIAVPTPWLALAIPSAVYFVLISKIAFYTDTRYLCLIYPLILCILVRVLGSTLFRVIDVRASCAALVMSLSLIICQSYNTYRVGTWEYGGTSTANLMDTLANYREESVVVLSDMNYRIEDTWMVNRNLSGVVFTSTENVQGLTNALAENADSFIVEIDSALNQQEMIDRLRDQYPSIDEVEEIGSMPYFTVYRFS